MNKEPPKIVGKGHSKSKMKKLKSNVEKVMELRKTDPMKQDKKMAACSKMKKK